MECRVIQSGSIVTRIKDLCALFSFDPGRSQSPDWCLNSIHESVCRHFQGGFSLWWLTKERISFGGLVGTRERRVTSIFHRLRNDQYDDIGGDKCIPLSTRANDLGPPSLNGTSRSPDLLICYEFANDTYVSRALRLHYVHPPKASPYFNLHAMSRSISNFLQLHIRLGRVLKARYQGRLMRVRENACTLLVIQGEKADPAIVVGRSLGRAAYVDVDIFPCAHCTCLEAKAG